MVDVNNTYSTEDIERVRKLYMSAASPEEIANITRMSMNYVNEIVSLIRRNQI